MNKNKIVSFVIILLFFVLISFFYWSEFINYHKNNFELEKINSQTIKKSNNFEIENISEIENIEFYNSPSLELKEKIINNINSAENYIYLEVYMFTEKSIKEALIKAFNKWIDVKIILEKDPYMAYSINDKFYTELKNKWINIVRSNDENYELNHSKFMIIDWKSMISTWNFTYSTFTKNRDLFLFIDDKNINKDLLQIFNDDFLWLNKTIYNENLIVSPLYSRDKIIKLLDSAENDIKIYIQYFLDDEIREKIINILGNKSIKITAIIPETAKEETETLELINAWVNMKVLSKNKMHSKAILVDEKTLFIWSENFSNYSIDKNREVWILIKNKEIIDKFLKLFNHDLNT